MQKRSVTATLARALAGIVVLSVLSTSLALLTLSDSLRDAEAINLAGSLRMQSYRLALDLTTHSPAFAEHVQSYQRTLTAPVLQQLDHIWVPASVRARYHQLTSNWFHQHHTLLQKDFRHYQQNVANHVNEINQFVLDLQRYAELKMRLAAIASTLGFIAIILLALRTIQVFRRQVIRPLNELVIASQHIEQGNFHYREQTAPLPDELAMLTKTFAHMSQELERHYNQLEQTVKIRTEDLTMANQTLGILYEASQALTVSKLDRPAMANALEIIHERARLTVIELVIGENWHVSCGQPDSTQQWQQLTLHQDGAPKGVLRWQAGEQAIPEPLMQSVGNMLARGIWVHQAQKQQQQLLLMEERATIARELHDSLAQALSFMRIQLILLKRTISKEDEAAGKIIADFDRSLNDAYQQLRELLTTFRLTIGQADLCAALQAMLTPLQQQTPARLVLHCQPDQEDLNAQQQIHILQIVREAVINAIKHASAQQITVHCEKVADSEHQIIISDDGCGMTTTEEPEGHYGLTIMHERAERLGGILAITPLSPKGTCVTLRFPISDQETERS